MWPSYQEQEDIMGGMGSGKQDWSAGGGLRPSEEMELYDEIEFAKKQRPKLMEAFVLPSYDLDRKTFPGHAPPGPFGSFGPRAPPVGNRVGDVLGATSSVLNARTAAKNLEECQKYVDLGCDVNQPFTCARNGDRMGWGPLHFAAHWDRTDVIRLLLSEGADPLMRSWEGETPVVIARKKGNWAAYRIFETFIATSTRKPKKSWPFDGYDSDEDDFVRPMDGVISEHGVVSPYKNPMKGLECAKKAHLDELDNEAPGGLHYSDQEYLSPSKVKYAFDYAKSPPKPVHKRQYDVFEYDSDEYDF